MVLRRQRCGAASELESAAQIQDLQKQVENKNQGVESLKGIHQQWQKLHNNVQHSTLQVVEASLAAMLCDKAKELNAQSDEQLTP